MSLTHLEKSQKFILNFLTVFHDISDLKNFVFSSY